MTRLPAIGQRPPAAAVVLVLLCAAPLQSAPPMLTNLMPRGAERGKAVEILVTGTNLTPKTQLVLPFKATQKLLADAKPNPAQVRVQITIDSAVPLGIYPVRLMTEEGVSGLMLFSVDAFPNVNEVEDNSTFDKAQKVPFPAIITGQCAGGDVDYFRFTAKKSQRVVVETEAARLGSGVVPQIRVTDAHKRFLASDDTQKVRGDCRVVFTAPGDGDYVVEISDSRYRGGNPPVYRLKIADYDVIEEVFPLGGRRGEKVSFTLHGGTLAKPVQVQHTLIGATDRPTQLLGLEGVVKVGMVSPRVAVGELPERTALKTGAPKVPKVLAVTPPLTLNGRLEQKDQVDRFQFPVKTGQRFRISVHAEALGSYLDGVLRITDQAGKQLILVDDVPIPAVAGQPGRLSVDPFTDVTVPAGVTGLIVELRDQRHRGGINFGYRLTIEPATLDFLVHQPVSEVNVPRGGSVGLTVPVTRRGFTGPILLGVLNLPAGWTVQGGYVPEGATQGVLTLSAAANAQAPAGLLFMRIEGKGSNAGQEIRRQAEQHMALNADPTVTTSTITLKQLAVALTSSAPFTVQGPAVITVVKGYPANVPVTITHGAKQTALAVEVTGVIPPRTAVAGLPAPVTFTFKPATAAAGAASAAVTVTPSVQAPEGRWIDLLVQGKATVNNVATMVTGPAVSLTVVRPFTVELVTPNLTGKAGQTIALKGKLQRQAVFKEAVQLTLTGLPAGVALAAAPKPIAANQNDFQIDLRVDPKAAAGMANLTLTCTTTIAGMAFTHPPVPVPLKVIPAK